MGRGWFGESVRRVFVLWKKKGKEVFVRRLRRLAQIEDGRQGKRRIGGNGQRVVWGIGAACLFFGRRRGKKFSSADCADWRRLKTEDREQGRIGGQRVLFGSL